jgi:hypothetical protein
MRKGGLARLLGTIYIRQCGTAGHINTWPVAQTVALMVDGRDFVMRKSLRDRCIVGFWLTLMGLATAGWLTGLTWASIWLFG